MDFRYFLDEDGYDEQTIVDGLKIARKVAETSPFKEWIDYEVAPGEAITSDEELSTYGRAVHHTVYHPSGTCRMGSADDDLAVVDPAARRARARGPVDRRRLRLPVDDHAQPDGRDVHDRRARGRARARAVLRRARAGRPRGRPAPPVVATRRRAPAPGSR